MLKYHLSDRIESLELKLSPSSLAGGVLADHARLAPAAYFAPAMASHYPDDHDLDGAVTADDDPPPNPEPPPGNIGGNPPPVTYPYLPPSGPGGPGS
jgi:hypothetical protein